MSDIEQLLSKLPNELRNEIEQIKEKDFLEEIRLRSGSPVILIINGREYRLKNDYYRVLSNKNVQDIFNKITNHSAYAYHNEIPKGYITIEGGHRVGICGKAVWEDGRIRSIKDITSLNLRRSREIKGVSDHFFSLLFDKDGSFLHTILVSPPMCGKTTLLRDIIRNLSEMGLRVGVCDERSEIAGSYQGNTSFNLGHRTDIVDGCSKDEGMMMLIRGMSPMVIATDEIGKKADLDAIEAALCAGVGILTTIHGSSREDLRRSSIGNLVRNGIFKRYIYLTNKPEIGTIKSITDENDNCLNKMPL